MGCFLAKASALGTPYHDHLENMKHAGDYVTRRDAPKRQQELLRMVPVAAEDSREGRGEPGGGGLRASATAGGEENEGSRVESSRPASQPTGNPVDGGDEELVNGWPRWLVNNIPQEVLAGFTPKSADCYEKIDKVGQGTYSNVYKARDRDTGKIVALKKVRFDTSESESVKFMAREIRILQKLDHPNVIKLEGIATSRMHYSLYLVFEYMHSDLTRIISCPDPRLTEPQVKCYMKQLLSGLQHCHERGILHRDIKGSNLLIDKNGVLKIADFGLANFYHPNKKELLTTRVVTLWYRAPELLLGTRDYGIGIDLWSAGCLLAEMFVGKPIMQGRNEIDQLCKIFMLCGSPSADYWRKLKLSNSFQLPAPSKPSILETYKYLPPSALSLLIVLLSPEPSNRGTAASALKSDFFTTNPLACDISDLPVIYKETDESIQPRERRTYRKKVLKLAESQRQRDDRRKLETMNIKVNSGSPKEDKPAASQDICSSAGSTRSSTSSNVKPELSVPTSDASSSQIVHPSKLEFKQTKGRQSGTKDINNFSPVLEADDTGLKNLNTQEQGSAKSSASMASALVRYHGRHISKVSTG